MSSGQSARNGNSVEPGLPNTFLMPNPRRRSRVACLTLTDPELGFAGLRDNVVTLKFVEMFRPSLRGAKFRRAGKAKRAHHFLSLEKLVGTAQARLCPPYD